jgi:hypothetical protein
MKIYRQIIKFLVPYSNWLGHLLVLLFLSNFLFVQLIECCVIFGTEQLEESLCKAKVCANYGRCKIDEKGFYAKCVCPTDCSGEGNDLEDLTSNVVNMPASISAAVLRQSRTEKLSGGGGGKALKKKRLNPKYKGSALSSAMASTNELFNHMVCGSNGQDYKSFCELKKHSCRQNRDNKIFYFGKCSKNIFILLLLFHLQKKLFSRFINSNRNFSMRTTPILSDCYFYKEIRANPNKNLGNPNKNLGNPNKNLGNPNKNYNHENKVFIPCKHFFVVIRHFKRFRWGSVTMQSILCKNIQTKRSYS